MREKHAKTWIKQTARVPRGYLRVQVLTLLRDSPKSGSEIAEIIEKATDGEYRPGPGSIYPVLKKLHQSGFIEKLPIEDGMQRYKLTEEGRSFFDKNQDVLDELRKRLDSVDFPMSSFQSISYLHSSMFKVSKAMMKWAEIQDADWDQELAKRVEEVLTDTARKLEEIVNEWRKKKGTKRRD